MSKLLDQALEEVKNLSEAEKDAIARIILDELADEDAWHKRFAASQGKLRELSAAARREIALGDVSDGDPSSEGT